MKCVNHKGNHLSCIVLASKSMRVPVDESAPATQLGFFSSGLHFWNIKFAFPHFLVHKGVFKNSLGVCVSVNSLAEQENIPLSQVIKVLIRSYGLIIGYVGVCVCACKHARVCVHIGVDFCCCIKFCFELYLNSSVSSVLFTNVLTHTYSQKYIVCLGLCHWSYTPSPPKQFQSGFGASA